MSCAAILRFDLVAGSDLFVRTTTLAERSGPDASAELTRIVRAVAMAWS
jgi:hypothetical protein